MKRPTSYETIKYGYLCQHQREDFEISHAIRPSMVRPISQNKPSNSEYTQKPSPLGSTTPSQPVTERFCRCSSPEFKKIDMKNKYNVTGV